MGPDELSYVLCQTCLGTGMTECFCEGDQDCHYCGGRAEATCPECQGRGLIPAEALSA